MGTSMRKAVFTEGVVKGLKRWKGRARKNVSLRNTTSTNWSARPSLDASIETLDTSPSFNNLEASFSLVDADYTTLDVTDHHQDQIAKQLQADQDHQKFGSFNGFDLTTKQIIPEEGL